MLTAWHMIGWLVVWAPLDRGVWRRSHLGQATSTKQLQSPQGHLLLGFGLQVVTAFALQTGALTKAIEAEL